MNKKTVILAALLGLAVVAGAVALRGKVQLPGTLQTEVAVAGDAIPATSPQQVESATPPGALKPEMEASEEAAPAPAPLQEAAVKPTSAAETAEAGAEAVTPVVAVEPVEAVNPPTNKREIAASKPVISPSPASPPPHSLPPVAPRADSGTEGQGTGDKLDKPLVQATPPESGPAGPAPQAAAAMSREEILAERMANDMPGAVEQALAEGRGVDRIISQALTIDGMNPHQLLLSLCESGANSRDITQAASENNISPIIIAAADEEGQAGQEGQGGQESDTQAYTRQARNNRRMVIPTVVRQLRERTDLFVSPSRFE
ncbi:MAG: hypothetical protein ABFR97_05315 [Thermodesulfobacteriota bacterium]